MGLRNLPTEHAAALAGLVTCRPGQVSSMALTAYGDAASAALFAFSAGESVSEEAYEGDVLYLLAEGEAHISLPDRTERLDAGDVLMVPRGVPHGIEGPGAFKVLQVIVP